MATEKRTATKTMTFIQFWEIFLLIDSHWENCSMKARFRLVTRWLCAIPVWFLLLEEVVINQEFYTCLLKGPRYS